MSAARPTVKPLQPSAAEVSNMHAHAWLAAAKLDGCNGIVPTHVPSFRGLLRLYDVLVRACGVPARPFGCAGSDQVTGTGAAERPASHAGDSAECERRAKTGAPRGRQGPDRGPPAGHQSDLKSGTSGRCAKTGTPGDRQLCSSHGKHPCGVVSSCALVCAHLTETHTHVHGCLKVAKPLSRAPSCHCRLSHNDTPAVRCSIKKKNLVH